MNQDFKLRNGDTLKLIKTIPSSSVDLIIADPPFGISFKDNLSSYDRREELVLEGYVEVPKEDYPKFTDTWIRESARILKETGSIYIFSSFQNLCIVRKAMASYNLELINEIIWKYQLAVPQVRKFRMSHYIILFAVKDRKKYTWNRIEMHPEDVWIINRKFWKGEKKTPTKLPLELVLKIMRFSSNENDLVFDPFAGSGTVGVACKVLNRRYLGFEINKKFCQFAIKRINQYHKCSLSPFFV